MKRRTLLASTTAAALSPAMVGAQPAGKLPVVGFLHPGVQALGSFTLDALKRDMGEQGFVDGQTVRIEERWGDGKSDRMMPLTRELLDLGPSVIIAVARPAIEACRRATTTVPIVGTDLENDPVASGYAASLGKPGGNVTGLFLDAPTICGKWLQQITELVPGLRKVSVLWDSSTGTYQRDALLERAKTVPLDVSMIDYRGGAPIESIVAAGLQPDAQALVMLGSPVINQSGLQIATVMTSRHLPAIGPFRTFPANGGLVSYGADLVAMYRRLVPFVAKVLRGAKPGDLPIEQPTKFELIVNLRTAKVLGLTIRPSILASADELIE